MKTINFPYIASALGIVFMLIVIRGSEIGADGASSIPLLSLLVINEFAFFATGAGAYIGIKHIRTIGFKPAYTIMTLLCLLLSVAFMFMGIKLWPL